MAEITTISPIPGNYDAVLSVVLACDTPGDITYSINNGPELVYAGPIEVAVDTFMTYTGPDGILKAAQYYIDISTIIYKVNGGPWIDYTEPFSAQQFQVVEAALRYSDGSISPSDVYNYAIDIIVYRINGGPWIDYTEPFECKHYWIVEAAVRHPNGTISDINRVSYTIVDTTDQWVMVG